MGFIQVLYRFCIGFPRGLYRVLFKLYISFI